MEISYHAYMRAKERLGIELTPQILRDILFRAKKQVHLTKKGEYIIFCWVQDKKIAIVFTKTLVVKTVFAAAHEGYAEWAERIKYEGVS